MRAYAVPPAVAPAVAVDAIDPMDAVDAMDAMDAMPTYARLYTRLCSPMPAYALKGNRSRRHALSFMRSASQSRRFDGFRVIFRVILLKSHVMTLENIRQYSKVFQNLPKYWKMFNFRIYDRFKFMKIDRNRPKRRVVTHGHTQVGTELRSSGLALA